MVGQRDGSLKSVDLTIGVRKPVEAGSVSSLELASL